MKSHHKTGFAVATVAFSALTAVIGTMQSGPSIAHCGSAMTARNQKQPQANLINNFGK
jgi:hypothetical protein